MECKYLQEKKLLYTYENDIHELKNNINSLNTGKKISPSINYDHFLNILIYLKININNSSILNIGSGHGLLDILIAKNFQNVNITSVEFSKNRIERSRYLQKKYNVHNINFVHEDLHLYLDNLNVNFDYIMAFEVIEHLYNQNEVINKCKLHCNKIFFGTIPIQPNCKQKQHISFFKSINHAKEIIKCNILNQDIIPLRLPECVFFYYTK